MIKIVIEEEAVCLANTRFAAAPRLDEVISLFSSLGRDFNEGQMYLPVRIFDEYGLSFRYRQEDQVVMLVDVYFATSGKPWQPRLPFQGEVMLNGVSLKRPILMARIKTSGAFMFDQKPVRAAGNKTIGVTLKPKFEYLGILNFGWQPFGQSLS